MMDGVLPLALAALLAAGPAAELPTLSTPPPAPREVYRVDLAVDLPVSAAAALAIAIPSLFASDLIAKRCPCSPGEVNGFDRGAIGNANAFADTTSDVTAVVAMAAPPLLDLVHLGYGRAWLEDGAVFAETLLVNGALVEAAKVIVQRPLPRTYAGDPKLLHDPGGYRSFYSGHTSTVFAALGAAAYTLRLREGEQVWPWLVTGAVGASVAVERVAAGRHFPSDVLVGAAAGLAVGVAVPWLHARPARDGAAMQFVPLGGGAPGLSAVGRF